MCTHTNVKKIFLISTMMLLPLLAMAETEYDRMERKHELRLGWGDQLFETLMWHNPGTITTTMPVEWTQTYHENYHHNQHIWLEYQYRPNRWLSFGGMFDMSEVNWDDVTRNGRGDELKRDRGHYFYNVVIMPTVRFTYFHHEYVNLYSGLGLGLGINGGSETDALGNHDLLGAAVNFTVFGVSVNYKRWFMAVDLGGLYSLKNANAIFLASSRMINASLGARF